MAEYSANAVQIVNPGESVIFTESPEPCNRGLVRHRDGTGNFLLSGKSKCPCQRCVNYNVATGANISIPTGGTVEAITIALTVDGATVPSSQMEVTPAAVEEYFNVSKVIDVPIWTGCCQTVTLRNTSAQPIQIKNANIDFTRPDLR